MKKQKILGILSLWMFVGCNSFQEKTSATAGASWYNTMHRLSANHSALTPIVSDPKEFYDPKNLPLLKEKTKEMMLGAVEMTKNSEAPNADPLIAFTADRFSKDMQNINEMLNSGQLQAAHYSLSQVGNYCISCHTRADRGNKNFPLPWATNLSNLNTAQKILYDLANRQYETAHKETEKIIDDQVALAQDPNAWMAVIQKDLAVLIRVQDDLNRAQKMISKILNNKNLPAYMQYDVKNWQQSLKEWQNENKKSKDATTNLAFVKKLLDQARSTTYSQGQAGLMIYLRASGILHELLESSRNAPTYSSALYFAGITAEALKTVDVWQLGEHYFEVCIENSPNTVISQKCYQQMENLTQKSYPNLSLMPELSKQIQNRLAKYRDLSRVQSPVVEKIRPNESGPRF